MINDVKDLKRNCEPRNDKKGGKQQNGDSLKHHIALGDNFRTDEDMHHGAKHHRIDTAYD